MDGINVGTLFAVLALQNDLSPALEQVEQDVQAFTDVTQSAAGQQSAFSGALTTTADILPLLDARTVSTTGAVADLGTDAVVAGASVATLGKASDSAAIAQKMMADMVKQANDAYDKANPATLLAAESTLSLSVAAEGAAYAFGLVTLAVIAFGPRIWELIGGWEGLKDIGSEALEVLGDLAIIIDPVLTHVFNALYNAIVVPIQALSDLGGMVVDFVVAAADLTGVPILFERIRDVIGALAAEGALEDLATDLQNIKPPEGFGGTADLSFGIDPNDTESLNKYIEAMDREIAASIKANDLRTATITQARDLHGGIELITEAQYRELGIIHESTTKRQANTTALREAKVAVEELIKVKGDLAFLMADIGAAASLVVAPAIQNMNASFTEAGQYITNELPSSTLALEAFDGALYKLPGTMITAGSTSQEVAASLVSTWRDTTQLITDYTVAGFGVLGDAIGGSTGEALTKWAQFGADMVDIWTNPQTGVVEKIIQSAIQLFAALADALFKSEGEKVVEGVRSWGVEITEELGDAIAQTAEELFGGSHTAAEIFHLDELLAADGGLDDSNFATFVGKLRDVFVMLETGIYDTSDAVVVLDTNFGTFAEHATSRTGLLSAEMREIIDLTRQFGVESEAIAAYIDTQLSGVIDGLNLRVGAFAALLDSLIGDENDLDDIHDIVVGLQSEFNALGVYAVTAFSAILTETGSVTQALAAIEPVMEQLIAAQQDLGFEAEGAFAGLLETYEIVKDNQDVIDAVEGVRLMMVGLHNTGYLTQELFTLFGDDVVTQFMRLTERGIDANKAMALMQPTLQTLWELQHQFGFAVDDSTQALLNEAEAAGLVGANWQDVTEQILLVLIAIAEVLGADLPDSLQSAADAWGDWESDAITSINNVQAAWDAAEFDAQVAEAQYQLQLAIESGDPDAIAAAQAALDAIIADGATRFWGSIWAGGPAPSSSTLPSGSTTVPTASGGLCINIQTVNVCGADGQQQAKSFFDALYSYVTSGGDALAQWRDLNCTAGAV